MFGIFVFIIVIHIGGQFNERLASLVASRSVFLSDCLCKQCFCLFLREINMMMMMMTEKTLDEYTTRTAHKFIVDDSKSILKYAKCHETTALCIRKVKLCEIWYKT